MDEFEITQFIAETFASVNVDRAGGDTFFSVDPERQFPFATIVTHDTDRDNASELDRPSVFRLNIGVSESTYASLFEAEPPGERNGGVIATGHDYAALDRLMPHPIDGRQYWISVLNPSAETFESIHPLLAEAHSLATSRNARRDSRA